MSDFLLFATSASSHLSPGILQDTPGLRPGLFRSGHFIDGEIMFYLDEPVKGMVCFVLGHTGPPADNLLEMFTIINTLKINGAKSVIAVIPYLGYSRSDRDKPLQPINSRLFAKFMKDAGATKIICLDLHSRLNQKYFTIPILHLSILPLLAGEIEELNIANLRIATPDKGGLQRAKNFAKALRLKNIIKIEKHRPSDTSAEVVQIQGDINNRNIILVDDMIQTGHTLVSAANALKAKGARDIYACVTHYIPQANAIKLLTSTSLFKKIYITNSLTNYLNLPTKVSVFDISHLLAKTISKEIKSFAASPR